jgi:iron-sulfur cluster assembly accessory protein
MKKLLPIEFTPRAWEQLMKLKHHHGKNETVFLRVGIKDASGCQGIFHSLQFEKTEKENDTVFEFKNQKIIVANKHLMHLVGLTIHYLESGTSKGFQFKTAPAVNKEQHQ